MAEQGSPPPGPDREHQLAHLSSSVGHHIINAFSAVVSNAELLKLSGSESGDDELTETVDMIINVSVRASGVIRRLIDYSRPATLPAEHSPVDLNASIGEIVSSFEPRHPEVSWSLEIQSLPPIIGDPDQLRLMFSHLLWNAIEAIGPSGGRVAIRGLGDQPEWSTLLIEDSGEGMDPRAHEQALEPFFTTKPGHLGIGLCLANSIWRRHGGMLAILSRPGEGTTLRMTYPKHPLD